MDTTRVNLASNSRQFRVSIGRRECKIYLLLFEGRFLVLFEAVAVPGSEHTRFVAIGVSYRVDFLSTRAAADIVAINYKCICSVEFPSR